MKIGAVMLLALVMGAQNEPRDERIYARVTTAGGDVLEGYLRWDRNEANWSDFLDGTKEIPWEHLREAEELDPDYGDAQRRERSIEAFGVRITWDRDDDTDPVTVTAGVRFGHLRSLVVLDDHRARLTLKTGDEVVLRSGSTDLGRSLRGVVVDDVVEGEVDLRWRDLDRVDFMAAPIDARPREERLHGTLTTRTGDQFTGFVAWDLDEVFATDVLDGDDVVDRTSHEIEFGDIAAIERDSRRTARVVLRDGTEVVLRGTNDVDEDNRGIEISDAAFGRAIVSWDEFDAISFHPQREAPATYDEFRSAAPLTGTVSTRDGREFVGRIRWDNDESFGWEVLDGRMDGIDYDIELRRVASIERSGVTGVEVTLLDGRAFELYGTNDVDRDNRGIFVTDSRGRTSLVLWADFERATLAW